MRSLALFFTAAVALAFAACNQNQAAQNAVESAKTIAVSQPTEATAPIAFDNYWFQGKAEITSYSLEQERYGEPRTGDVVLVFVTEDFSKKKQVKLDDGQKAGDDRVPILKLNTVKKFKTGIYDYSMFQSVFTPIDLKTFPRSLKTACSNQEWCGNTFTQLNLDGKNWRLREFSYFETEGDIDQKLPAALLEDELWTRLRIDPASIPTGDVELVPALFFSRLKHEKFRVEAATISMQTVGNERVMKLEYKKLSRSLTIRCEAVSPYKIIGWEEMVGGK